MSRGDERRMSRTHCLLGYGIRSWRAATPWARSQARLGNRTRRPAAPILPIRRRLSREPLRLDRRCPRAGSSRSDRSEHLAALAICWRGFVAWRFGLDRRLLRDRCAHVGRSDCWRSRPGTLRFPPRSRLTSRDSGGRSRQIEEPLPRRRPGVRASARDYDANAAHAAA